MITRTTTPASGISTTKRLSAISLPSFSKRIRNMLQKEEKLRETELEQLATITRSITSEAGRTVLGKRLEPDGTYKDVVDDVIYDMLRKAMMRKHPDALRVLYENGIDPNIILPSTVDNSSLRTPAHLAVGSAFFQRHARTTLEGGANVFAKVGSDGRVHFQGQSAIDVARKAGNAALADELIKSVGNDDAYVNGLVALRQIAKRIGVGEAAKPCETAKDTFEEELRSIHLELQTYMIGGGVPKSMAGSESWLKEIKGMFDSPVVCAALRKAAADAVTPRYAESFFQIDFAFHFLFKALEGNNVEATEILLGLVDNPYGPDAAGRKLLDIRANSLLEHKPMRVDGSPLADLLDDKKDVSKQSAHQVVLDWMKRDPVFIGALQMLDFDTAAPLKPEEIRKEQFERELQKACEKACQILKDRKNTFKNAGMLSSVEAWDVQFERIVTKLSQPVVKAALKRAGISEDETLGVILHAAAGFGSARATEILLRLEWNVYARNQAGLTAFQIQVSEGQDLIEAAKVRNALIARVEADPNYMNANLLKENRELRELDVTKLLPNEGFLPAHSGSAAEKSEDVLSYSSVDIKTITAAAALGSAKPAEAPGEGFSLVGAPTTYVRQPWAASVEVAVAPSADASDTQSEVELPLIDLKVAEPEPASPVATAFAEVHAPIPLPPARNVPAQPVVAEEQVVELGPEVLKNFVAAASPKLLPPPLVVKPRPPVEFEAEDLDAVVPADEASPRPARP